MGWRSKSDMHADSCRHTSVHITGHMHRQFGLVIVHLTYEKATLTAQGVVSDPVRP